jgi:hypothetical protein
MFVINDEFALKDKRFLFIFRVFSLSASAFRNPRRIRKIITGLRGLDVNGLSNVTGSSRLLYSRVPAGQVKSEARKQMSIEKASSSPVK